MAGKKTDSSDTEKKEVKKEVKKEAETSAVADSDGTSLFNQSMDILHDIDMDITVEIGSVKIKISELLNLKKGSVIELNQMAQDPLIIYANDKPIAKGHVMEVNGKYCVRII